MEQRITARLYGPPSVDVRLHDRETLSARLRIGGGGPNIEYGHGLKLEDGVLSVDCANVVEQDNTLPVTSAAVYVELGNVEALLAAL